MLNVYLALLCSFILVIGTPTEKIEKDLQNDLLKKLINETNTKKEYESFTFGVENLTPNTSALLETYENKKILEVNFLNSMFEYGKNEKILAYSLETGEKNISYLSAIGGYIQAYRNHFPMTISPDIFWLLIMQGFSRYMDDFHEKLRSKFVDFEGKKELIIWRDYDFVQQPSLKEFNSIIIELNEKIGEYIGNQYIDLFTPSFTTTTVQSFISGKISIMSTMRHYFDYYFGITCGVSKMTIEGSLDDWMKLKEKIKLLGKIDEPIEKWSEKVIPIMDKIIETIKTRKPDIDFWKSFIIEKYIPAGNYCGARPKNYVNGWITKFYFYNSETKREFYRYNQSNLILEESEDYSEKYNGDTIEIEDFPTEILKVPFKVINYNGNLMYNCSFESGIVGVEQDKETFNIKPVIGYVIKYEQEEKE